MKLLGIFKGISHRYSRWSDHPNFQTAVSRCSSDCCRRRFRELLENVMQADLLFYASQVDATGRKGASLESKILSPLKMLAFGTAEHGFSDYFQMSKALASKGCKAFANMMRCILYSDEYLCISDANDLKVIRTRLHHEINRVHGIFGSLDCMHTRWKNCPNA